MIELITGQPGHGKTLYTLWSVKAKAEKEKRPVYYSGIPDLNLPWTEIDPEKWFECPPNSLIVIDECQRLFRPRSFGGTVPPYVAELETHRHKGLDLFLITQHPMLVDSNVRRLVGNHKHVSRRFGMQRSSIFEYESCKDQPLAKIENATARHEWRYPREVYSLYKSAEVHTVKARLPAKVWIIAGGIVLALGTSYWFVSRWVGKVKGEETPVLSQSAKTVASGRISSSDENPFEWYQDHAARVVGLPATAPVYDEVVKPTIAPEPVACVSMADRCTCFTQQATRMDVPDGLCRQIVSNGYFNDHPQKDGIAVAGRVVSERAVPQSEAVASSPNMQIATGADPVEPRHLVRNNPQLKAPKS